MYYFLIHRDSYFDKHIIFILIFFLYTFLIIDIISSYFVYLTLPNSILIKCKNYKGNPRFISGWYHCGFEVVKWNAFSSTLVVVMCILKFVNSRVE